MNKISKKEGLIFALIAFISWGLVPLFWKQFIGIDPVEVMAYRIITGVMYLLIFILMAMNSQKRSDFFALYKNKNIFLPLFLTSILIVTNWLVYVWAVVNNYIIETSIGYFINPLVNILLGVIFLKERPRKYQWVSIALAFAGISVLLISGVGRPSISLALAFSFGFYGLFRKAFNIPSLPGLTFEKLCWILPSIGYLLYISQGDAELSLFISTKTFILVLLGGLVSIGPMLAFGRALQGLNLTSIGILQFIAPSMHLIIGVLVYDELFSIYHRIAFCFIWVAIFIFIYDLRKSKKYDK